jgi:hypothetical protein
MDQLMAVFHVHFSVKFIELSYDDKDQGKLDRPMPLYQDERLCHCGSVKLWSK